MWERAVRVGTQHRHLVVGGGLLLVAAAVWCAFQRDHVLRDGDVDEGFAELHDFDAPAPLSPETAQPAPLSLPPAPSEVRPEEPLNLGPVLSEAGLIPYPAITAVHSTAAEERSPASPVWLTGTIETDNDAPQPLSEAVMRYSQAVGRDDRWQR